MAIPPEAIATAGTYIVTLKCEGEAFPDAHRAIWWWALSQSGFHHRGRGVRKQRQALTKSTKIVES